MKTIILVFLGGGLGSVLRYLISYLVLEQSRSWPWATLVANIVACFILGFIVTLIPVRQLSDEYKWLIATGFCGGLSTFSTFGLELFSMQRDFIAMALYIGTSVVLGLIAIWLGVKTVEFIS